MGYIQRYRKHVKASLTEDNQAVCLYFEYPRKVGILRNLHYYAYGPVFLPKVKFGKWLTIAALGDVLDAKKLDFLKDRGAFLYIFFLCTMPSAQGKGLGSHLLRHAVTEADERDMAMYLEASTEDSRRLYKRHGFVDMEILYPKRDAPPLFLMYRPARSETAKSVEL